MAQPIRKSIQEIHSDLIKEKSTLTLIVDGNSLLFSSFADPTVNEDGEYVGAIWQFLLQLRMQLSKRQFDRVFITFDDTNSGFLRYNLYKSYKQNRDKHYEEYGTSDYMKEFNENLRRMQDYIYKNKKLDKKKNEKESFIDEHFDSCRDRLCLYFNEMCIRWHMDEVCEGDDLIAYYVKNKKPNEKILIISSDLDLCQLLCDDILIYNQNKKLYLSNKNFKHYFGYPHENILVKKVFCGDVSDNIGNIKGLSEKGFFEIIPESKEKIITIEDVKTKVNKLIEERLNNKKKPLRVHENIINGVSNKYYEGDFYQINKKIIDLKEPIMTDDCVEEMYSLMNLPLDVSDRSYKNLIMLVNEDKIPELNSDTKFASFFSVFKRIEEKEREKYIEYDENK